MTHQVVKTFELHIINFSQFTIKNAASERAFRVAKAKSFIKNIEFVVFFNKKRIGLKRIFLFLTAVRLIYLIFPAYYLGISVCRDP